MNENNDLLVGADTVRNSVYPIGSDWMILGWREGNILWRRGLRVTILDMEACRAYLFLLNDRIAIFTFTIHELPALESETDRAVAITFHPWIGNMLEIALEWQQLNASDRDAMLAVAQLAPETHEYLRRRFTRR
jgi:hypothetical protein